MTKTIFAEDLKQWDKIIIPATSQTVKREFRVSTIPEVGDLMVNAFAFKIKNGVSLSNETPIQFGRKVDLMIERVE